MYEIDFSWKDILVCMQFKYSNLLEVDRRRMKMSDIEVGEVFTLSDENNEEQEVEVLGAMDVEGAEYIAVAFVEDIQTESEEDIDIFFLKVEEDNEFSYIENDEEFEKVSAAFDKILDEQEQE